MNMHSAEKRAEFLCKYSMELKFIYFFTDQKLRSLAVQTSPCVYFMCLEFGHICLKYTTFNNIVKPVS